MYITLPMYLEDFLSQFVSFRQNSLEEEDKKCI